MFENINKKKLTGLILAGIITVAGAAPAFAADQPSGQTVTANQKQLFKIDKEDLSSKVKSAIDSLVASGTITQAQADAVIKAYTPGDGRKAFKGGFRNPLSELVDAGTITQAQADAFDEAVKSAIESRKLTTDILKELVSAGTITQAQADAINNNIKTGFESKMRLNKEAPEKDITNTKKSFTDSLNDLVAAGTITQAQADAVQKIHTPFDHKDAFVGFKHNPLDELVAAGTITQAQADAINSAVKAALSSLNE